MKQIQKRYGIIVGVSKYEGGENISELPFAKNDAVRLYEILVRKAGFESDRVYLLINDASGDNNGNISLPTRGNILQKIKYVTDAASENDLILFFFAGHGLEISKSPYLLTSDTKMDILSDTAVDVKKVNEMCESSKAKCVVRFFDACRSPFGEGRAIAERMTQGFQDAILKTAEGWATFSACSIGEVSHESGDFDQGVFSYFLCEGLEGKAANDEGSVTFERLVDYVKTSVGNWCDQQTLKQTPNIKSDLSGTLTLTKVQKVVEEVSPPVEQPLGELYAGLDLHLSKAALDVRNLTYTDADEMKVVSDLVFSTIDGIIKDFSHPKIDISCSEIKTIKESGERLKEALTREAQRQKVIRLFKSASFVEIDFKSSEIIIPNSFVFIVVVRFPFFYWLWYYHSYLRGEGEKGEISLDPEEATGFFTFKPKAARERIKVERTVKEIFSRCSETIITWSEQMSQYLDSTIGPLRDMGPIIE